METTIKQLSRRYHLQPDQRDLQRELDDTVAQAFDEGLDVALAQLGIDSREEICLRLVQVPLAFDPDQSRQRNAELWSRHIAEAIGAALAGRNGDAGNIVRYPSRLHGLLDFALEVSAGRTGRAWAWNQLGWCSLPDNPAPAEARRQLANALCREPALLLPLFVRLAEAGRLFPLLRELPQADCRALLQGIFTVAGVEPRWLNSEAPEVPATERGIVDGEIPAPVALRNSVIARHLSESPRALPHHSAIPRRQWLLLGLIELEPALFSRTPGAIAAQLAAAEVQWRRLTAEGIGEVRRAPRLQKTHDEYLEEVRGKNIPSAEQQESTFSNAVNLHSGLGEIGDFHSDKAARERSATEHRKIIAPEEEGSEITALREIDVAEEAIVDPRLEPATLHSEWAGLFYLLPLLDRIPTEEGIAFALAGSDEFSRRSLAWVFFHFFRRAFEYADCEDFPGEDPSLRLLCNLSVEEETPDFEDPEDGELEVLDIQVQRLFSALEASLPQPELSPGGRWRWLCQRGARLQLDPTWAEVVFPLQGLDTEVRRAGLDLDPGYVRWLGKVVKIRYE
ncbi:hypothetical protein [Microbulbifer rhizosphaerae]|uniref:Uncharacterized protein n=1 Tax=Microbulbifer rhizosphaerae TaxID=1562603 RepID=A0A7W4WF67_9GAMM|nr:hypothetical protein [Microbulbifer rhizosphaerae]MBB3063124.1 hypothetical protein [Microbulbifer rhizosphaerae]